jgi:hypothetical protein
MGRGLALSIRALASVAVVLLIGAAEASAGHAQQIGQEPSYRSYYSTVALDDGYELDFFAGARIDRDRGGFQLAVSDTIGRGYSSSYYLTRTPSAVENRNLRGPIGAAGSVDLTFTPTGPAVTERYRCVEIKTRPGVLVGSLRFEGEGSFGDIDETRLEAERSETDWRKCDPSKGGSGNGVKPDRPEAQLTACLDRPDVTWQATRWSDGKTTIIGFGRSYVSRNLYTTSFLYRSVRPGAFEYEPDFSAASIAPPAPFLGSGAYADGAVTGDLRWVAPNGDVNPMATHDATLARSDYRACAGIITIGGGSSNVTTGPARSLRQGLPRADMSWLPRRLP